MIMIPCLKRRLLKSLEDIVWCYHISVNDNDPLEEKDAGDDPLELEEGVKTTIDPLKDGTGMVFVTSQEETLPFSFTLKQRCSYNVVEYQALILGHEMAVDMKQLHLQVFGDHQLVINQLLGSYEVKKPKFCPYHVYAK
uniref:Ribonuclease H n=1 Tax=Solanum tuberosum TaxID=4113 RepID=M1DCG6_SOLTU